MAKCRGCGNDTTDILADPGWMHFKCEIERLQGLYDESQSSENNLLSKLATIERDTEQAKDNHDRAEEIIDAREVEIRRLQMEQQELWSANLRLTTSNTALRKVLLSAQVRLNSPLAMVKCKGFGELMRKINETLKETEVG